jgi:hypothetical protein
VILLGRYTGTPNATRWRGKGESRSRYDERTRSTAKVPRAIATHHATDNRTLSGKLTPTTASAPASTVVTRATNERRWARDGRGQEPPQGRTNKFGESVAPVARVIEP